MRMALPWRIAISLLIASLLIMIIWLTSQFKEPPEINAFVLLLLLIIHSIFELIYFLQERVFSGVFPPTTKWAVLEVALKNIIAGTLLYVLLFAGFKYLDYLFYHSEYPNLYHLKSAALIGTILSISFTFILLAIRLNQAHFQKIIENERFKNQLITANLTILNQQLDPHFLFNNFNTLYYLIDENSELAKQFLKNMSSIYRHMLQGQQQGLIPAYQEYEVAKQYLNILSLRYEQALVINDQIQADDLKNKHLPPLVLQQLLENAIKHNQIDPQSPLNITLRSTASSLLVVNSVAPCVPDHSSGQGLTNIISRYRHLSTQEVLIEKTAEVFRVQIPLLEHED